MGGRRGRREGLPYILKVFVHVSACVPKSAVARNFSTLRLCCMSCVGW